MSEHYLIVQDASEAMVAGDVEPGECANLIYSTQNSAVQTMHSFVSNTGTFSDRAFPSSRTKVRVY